MFYITKNIISKFLDQEELPVELTFCFQENIILNVSLKKQNIQEPIQHIGNQIYNKLKKQKEFEKEIQDLIAEKVKKVNLIQEEEINKLNEEIKKYAENLKLSINSFGNDFSKYYKKLKELKKL